MNTYTVQHGDSPASIAARYAGCPKCSRDLVLHPANSHKSRITYPNGFVTFRDLSVGEQLVLPDKWFSKEFDALPPSYFAALPYADGVTPSHGAIGDQPALQTAQANVAAMSAMDDQSFSNAVGDAGNQINAAVQEAYGSSNAQAASYAQQVQDGTHWAWQRNADMAAALANADTSGAQAARLDITNALNTAIGNAQLALNAYYSQPAPTPTPTPSGFPPALVGAAQAAAAAMLSDANYCTSVAQPGSSVNSAVHAFKLAWNAYQSAPVPIGTGNYEAATAAALAQVLGSAPNACGGGVRPPPPPPPPRQQCPPGTALVNGVCRVIPAPQPQAQQDGGLSTGAIVGIGLLGAATIGGVVYAATRTPSRGRRRRARARR